MRNSPSEEVPMEEVVIFAVVERGRADEIVKKATAAGATGATIFFGRGSGEKTVPFFRSLNIEAAKEVIIIVCQREKAQAIYEAVTSAGHFHEHGKGLAFMLPVLAVDGLINDK
jgi:nitrogen regulatory protein PII